MSQQYMPPNPSRVQGSNTLKIVLIVLGIVIAIMVLGCGVLAALLFPAISAAREAAQRQMGANNLKMIGLAFLNYESAYKRLPALHGINHDNEPTGNWRIAVSPFMESTAVFNRFDHKKRWDSPENQPLAEMMPAYFRSPLADAKQPPNQTNYFTIQDTNSVFSGGGIYRKLFDVLDGTSNTVVAIELPEYSAPWMQPNDLTIAEALSHIRASKHPERIQMLMLDGSVLKIGQLSDQDFGRLVTINDGNAVPLSY